MATQTSNTRLIRSYAEQIMQLATSAEKLYQKINAEANKNKANIPFDSIEDPIASMNHYINGLKECTMKVQSALR